MKLPNFFPSRTAFALLMTVYAIDFSWSTIQGIQISKGQVALVLLLVFVGAPISIKLRSTFTLETASQPVHPVAKPLALLQGGIFLLMAWIGVRLLNHLSMATSLPYADQLLSDWDMQLGFNWMAYFQYIRKNSFARTILEYSYTSLTPLSILAYLITCAFRNISRAGFFLESFFATALACTIIGMFFPAKAAVATYLGTSFDFSPFHSPPGTYHIVYMDHLRGTNPISLDLRNLPGLVTFPSFHTAAGIVLIWSFRRTFLFVPALLYSSVMIASTPVFGGHYFVDLLAGAGLALAVLLTLSRTQRYSKLFKVDKETASSD